MFGPPPTFATRMSGSQYYKGTLRGHRYSMSVQSFESIRPFERDENHIYQADESVLKIDFASFGNGSYCDSFNG